MTSWNEHCDSIYKKATERLFVLWTLKRVGLGTNDLVLIYCSIVRSIVEYALPVWAAVPLYLDELIESVPRKALKIICGQVNYTEALVLAGLESLSDRRVGACKRFMATAHQRSPLKNIIPFSAAIESHYSIRVQLPRCQHGHTFLNFLSLQVPMLMRDVNMYRCQRNMTLILFMLMTQTRSKRPKMAVNKWILQMMMLMLWMTDSRGIHNERPDPHLG